MFISDQAKKIGLAYLVCQPDLRSMDAAFCCYRTEGSLFAGHSNDAFLHSPIKIPYRFRAGLLNRIKQRAGLSHSFLPNASLSFKRIQLTPPGDTATDPENRIRFRTILGKTITTDRDTKMMHRGWSSELETGISSLDSGNKSLFMLAGRLDQACKSTNLSALKSALVDLNTEMAKHFDREEKLMAECEYAADGHWDEHQQVIAEIREKLEALESFEDDVLGFGRVIHNWLIQHIADQDRLFGRAVITQNGTTDRRRETDENFNVFSERRLEQLEAIEWPQEIATGVEAIDTDFPRIIGLLNQIVGERLTSERPALAGLFEQFGNELETHFRNQEALMTSIGYAQTADHQKEHNQLLDEFGQLLDDWQGNKLSAELLCRFVYRWMLRHFSSFDTTLGEALRQKTA